MFDRAYEVILADNPASKAIHYRIRYLVYCMETGFEDHSRYPEGLEYDDWDEHAAHFIVRSRGTGEWIGAMRLILPNQGSLPIQHLCKIDKDAHPETNTAQLGELSRLCIVEHARRRLHEHPETNGIATLTPASGARREPEILIGLLRAAAAYSREIGITHWYYMTTAVLARAMKRLNITLNPVGPAVQHRGDRYPFLADMEESMQRIGSTSAEHEAMMGRCCAFQLYSSVFGDDVTSMPDIPQQSVVRDLRATGT